MHDSLHPLPNTFVYHRSISNTGKRRPKLDRLTAPLNGSRKWRLRPSRCEPKTANPKPQA